MKLTRALGEFRRFLGADRRLTFALLLAVVSAIATVLVPFLLAKITDVIFAGVVGARFAPGTSREAVIDTLRAAGDDRTANIVSASDAVPGAGIAWTDLRTAALLAVGMLLVVTASKIGSGLLVNATVQGAIRGLRARVENKLHRLPVAALEGRRRGEVLNAVTVDVDNLATIIGPVFVQLPVLLLTIVAVACALLLTSVFFALIVFATVPVTVIVVVVILRRARPHVERQWQTTSALTAHAEDVYAARDMLAAYDAHPQIEREFADLNGRLERSARGGQTWSGSIAPILTLCNALVFVAVAVLGALKMLDGAITLGALQAVVLYAQQLSSPITDLASTLPRLQSGLISFGRVRTFLAQPEEEAPAVDDPAVPPGGRHRLPPRVVFDGVRFAYGDGPAVLDGVDLVVEPGRTTALVGATGSGKTTLTALLQRFADPTAGRITIDDQDVTTMSRAQVRALLAVVTQEPWLFTGTAGENIGYGSPDGALPDDPMVHRVLDTLPNGAGTPLSGDAETLSAGEKQLVTVARALAARPDILILDEATSSADPRSELLIQRGLDVLRHRTTTLIVTHRMSTLASADEVAVLDGGRIVERGTAAELMARGGVFTRLYAASDTDASA